MTPYGFFHERNPLGRRYPDCLDVSNLGLPSRHGRSRNKRKTRRYLKRKERRHAVREIEKQLDFSMC
jgi:hypothetical protein